MATYGYLLFSNFLAFVLCTNIPENDFRFISHQDLQLSFSRFSENGVTSYSQMLFDVARNQVIVGARDSLYRLSLPHLTLLENATWSAPQNKIALCLTKGQSEENCHNYVKVLLTNGKRIFTCGTSAFSPMCSWREIENISVVTEWVDGIARCPYNPLSNITALMSENGAYYVGGPTDFSGSDAAIYRSLGGRNTIRTTQYNSMWLNEPQFVGTFETDKFVYFLFREAAVEYINCGKIVYSRIARVCKNDAGGELMLKDNWTTFLKARLNCSISGDYPFYFDEIQSTSYVPEENIIYATFTTPSNSIAGSAICAFNLTAINEAFSGPFKYQEHIGSSWDKHYSQHQDHFQCKKSLTSTKYLVESSRYQLMDNAVQATTLTPLYTANLERFTHITVSVMATKAYPSVHVIYVATLAGLIKKLTVLPGTQSTCVIEIWQPVADTRIPLLSLQYLKDTDSVYVGTSKELLRVPAHHCTRHVSRNSCLNAMDPYCGWNEIEEACTTAPHADPFARHWHQSFTSCPILDAPVDGGWSSWSNWAKCQHRGASEPDSQDECLCQTRQCNNPAPQNGGKQCMGLSIAVTNCTVHGGWTPWSAWSACSQTCGTAVKSRSRTCSNPTPAHGGRVCVGQASIETLCIENPPCPALTLPPQDGQWSVWEEWSTCSTPCGGGYRKRQRKCNNPYPMNGGLDCSGCNIEYETCNTHSCPEQRRHGPWTPWLLVNSTNGKYTERRFRFTCQAPVRDTRHIKITLSKDEERICTDDHCLQVTENWSSWSPWSECSESCGGGIQKRTRTCESRGGECQGQSFQTKPCNKQPCKGEWGCWTEWSKCSTSCGPGIKERHRECLDVDCEGAEIEQEPCEGPPCASVLGWNSWTVWSVCDENNEQHRKRTCRTTNPGLNMCQGPERETRMCFPNLISNDLTPMLDYATDVASASTGTFVAVTLAGFIAGLAIACVMFYLYLRRKKPRLPSSPHYISAKQNPYITVPLQELPLKRHGASTSNSILNNSHNGTLKSNKCYDYDTATIKRNSHGLNNGHMKSDNFYYD